MTDRRHADSGFTLLEVVLAMTLLALVVAICYGAFHLGIRAVEKGEVAVVTTQRLRVASDVIIRQIKSAVPYAVRNEDDDVYPYFEGSGTSMRFVTTAGMQSGGSLAVVEYRLEEDPTRLVMREGVAFSPDGLGHGKLGMSEERSVVLLDGFRTVSFEYMLNDGADTEWRRSWDGHVEEMLPAAVRVLIDGLPGADSKWGQEIPTMACQYGDSQCEVEEDEEGSCAGEGGVVVEDNNDYGTGPNGGNGKTGLGSGNGGGNTEEEGGGDE
ncbi:MAG: prepilin-type N-terminal cleavage/methylation domain-containing protein [Thermoplasmata archaeon]|nr:prepilin-type N-terminal cleavage/methylation domain-containing protein [Thermoplasmata archaeon]